MVRSVKNKGIVTSLGMLRYAVEFQAAARAVDRKLGDQRGYETRAPTTVYYLVGHSIELAMKAFLLHKGKTEKQIIAFGHDLMRCWEACAELQFELDSGNQGLDVAVLRIFNTQYSDKQFEYFEGGLKEFASPGLLFDFSDRLLRSVSRYVPSSNRLFEKWI